MLIIPNDIIDLSDISPNHKYALTVPIEKIFLHHFAKKLAPGSLIVEIGTFLGGCASIMSYANPNITIVTIDQYDHYEWDANQKEMILSASNGQKQFRDIELVKTLNEDYNNIIFLSGTSPYAFADWNKEIDIYIEDGTHSGKNLSDNINFWITKIKSKGYIFLHDYRPYLPETFWLRFKDVENHVVDLQNQHGYSFLGTYGDYAVLQKP